MDAVRSTVLQVSRKAGRLILVACGLGLACSAVAGQIARPTVDPLNSISADKRSPDSPENQRGNSMAEELRIKREIKSAERDHEQHLERAKEVSDLGQELLTSFKKNNALNREDIKKLEKLEKLAKRIRSEAGGSDHVKIIETMPGDIVEALDCVAKVSNALNEKVQETPRQVVSTAIIDNANVLLELVRIVRSFSRKV